MDETMQAKGHQRFSEATGEVWLAWIGAFRHKATVMREISSQKAEKKRKWDLRHTLATVILGALLTFLGFMGAEKLYENTVVATENAPVPLNPASSPQLSLDKNQKVFQKSQANKETEKKTFDTAFSVLVLLLFIVSLLNLIFRWKEEHTTHFQCVLRLTNYINWLDELKLRVSNGERLNDLGEIRRRYQYLVEQLPPNSYSDYLMAKRRLSGKSMGLIARLRDYFGEISDAPQTSGDIKNVVMLDDTLFVKNLLLSSPIHMEVLKALRGTGSNLWLGGGAVRNFVWDVLTNSTTVFDDFDVVYFDSDACAKRDEKIEIEINSKLSPKLKISVKNQARMASSRGEPEVSDLSAAITNWPETATAIAIQLDSSGDICMIAPHGLTDLLALVVRPTPWHRDNPKAYKKRWREKAWSRNWSGITRAE